MSISWWKDKSVWLNTLASIIAIIQAIQGQAWFPISYQVFILAVLNAVVRLLTGEPISGTPTATVINAKIDEITKAKATAMNKAYVRNLKNK